MFSLRKFSLFAYHFKTYWAGTLRLVWNKENSSSFSVLLKFLTIFDIYEDFSQFSQIWSLDDSRIFLKSILISWNIQIFSNFWTELKSMIYFLPFETSPGVLAHFFRNGMQINGASSWKKIWKSYFCFKNEFFSMFCQSSTILYSKLRFCITKPQYITNIPWKFEDFLPSSLGVIKV